MSFSEQPGNPLQGDPSLIQQKAAHYRDIAVALLRSVATLDTVADTSEMKSEAIDAVRESARSVAADIKLAQKRYAATADALLGYQAELRVAQEMADQANRDLVRATDDLDTARAARIRAEAHADDSPASHRTWEDADDDVQRAVAAHGRACDAYRAALEHKWNAARAASSAISAVTEGKVGGKLNDSWWDDWGSKAYAIFKTICDVASILAIFLAWVPFLGVVLLALAAIGAVLALVDSIVKVAAGGGSWGDVALAAVGVVLTFFGGALVKHLGKLAKATIVMKSAPATVADDLVGTIAGRVTGSTDAAYAAVKADSVKRLTFGFWDIVKEPFVDLVPKVIAKADLTAGKITEKLVTDPLLKGVKFNKDTFAALQLAFKNPAVLADPMTFSRLGLAVTASGVQMTNAITHLDFTNPMTAALGPIGTLVKDGVRISDAFTGVAP